MVEQTVVSIRGTISFGTPKSDASRRPVALPGFVIDAVRGPWEKAINPKEAAKKLDGVFKV